MRFFLQFAQEKVLEQTSQNIVEQTCAVGK